MEEVDKLIETLAKHLQDASLIFDDGYAKNINALAALIEARASMNEC